MSKLNQIIKILTSTPPLQRRINPYAVARVNNGARRRVPIHNSNLRKPAQNIQQRSMSSFQIDRLTSDWLGSSTDVNSILRGGMVRSRSRARQMSIEDPYAKKYLKLIERNVVGPDGFTLRNKAGDFKFDEKKNKYVFQFDKSANSKIKEAWDEWSKPEFCTVTGDISFREVCSLALKTIATDGEILIKEHKGGFNKFGYALQLITADYLDETFTAQLNNGNIVIMGVEVDKFGKPVAYWMKKPSYSNIAYGSVVTGDRYRVLAEDPKKGDLIHLFVKETPNQKRGLSWFIPGMVRLKMLSGYEEAILVDARLTADRHVAIQRIDGTTPDVEINSANVGYPNTSNQNNLQTTPPQTDAVGNQINYQPSEPGEWVKIPDGWKAVPLDFKSPSGKESDFTKNSLRGIASGWDIAYIELANNYEGVNYTSSRSNLLDAREAWKTLHSWTREHKLNRINSSWLEMALLSGAINLPVEKFERFNKAWFNGRAWQWVSPSDEADAIFKIISKNLGSLDEFLSERGWGLEEFVDQLVYEHELFEDNGLEWPSDNGSTPAITTDEEDTKAEDEETVPKNGKAKKVTVEE